MLTKRSDGHVKNRFGFSKRFEDDGSAVIALFLSSIIGSIDSNECIVISESISKIVINIINNSSMTIWIQSAQKLLVSKGT
ncbi:hypothetical protein CUMW_269190 [Citrus unshiu]|uniref:Uncharacterized protein n=1 Tax=Citrus unshiu TaxID=55188 RepID=A0A2H5QWT8_CITUN|nr:hypothetical protein CUMW_269190 [Citrus unshiu]